MAKSKAMPNELKETVDKKMVSVMFKGNRKFDLHIGREMETFMARERKDIPASWLKHSDFSNVAKYFVIKGV